MTGTNDPQGMGGGPVLETVTPNAADLRERRRRPCTTPGSASRLLRRPTADSTCSRGSPTSRQAGHPADRAVQLGEASGTLWGDGTPGGVGDPASPTPATDPNLAFEEDCANGVLPDVSWLFIGTSCRRAPAEPPGGRRAVPRLEARGARRQRGPVEHDRVRAQLRRERRVLRPRAAADPGPAPVPRGVRDHGHRRQGTPGRRPAGRRRVPGAVLDHLAVDDGRPDLLRGLRPHLVPAVHRGRHRRRRPVGPGPVTFPNISRWRRQTFGDFTGALRRDRAAGAASPQFDPATSGGQPGRPDRRRRSCRCRRSRARTQTMPVQLKKLPA